MRIEQGARIIVERWIQAKPEDVLQVAKIREAGVPASVSNSAGTFVCNHLMYGVLYTLEKKYPGVRGGFMHVPFAPSQAVGIPAPTPSMSMGDMARGIEAAIAAIAENSADIAAVEGQTH